MTKLILIVLSLMMVLCIGNASIALADVPDPYGNRINRRIPPPPIQYWISKEKHNSSFSQDKYAIVYDYMAPQGSEIQYKVKDEAGNILLQGTEIAEDKNGKIYLLLDKPEPEKTCTIKFESTCCLAMVKTSFGMKKTDNPVFVDSMSFAYKVTGSKSGYVDIERIE